MITIEKFIVPSGKLPWSSEKYLFSGNSWAKETLIPENIVGPVIYLDASWYEEIKSSIPFQVREEKQFHFMLSLKGPLVPPSPLHPQYISFIILEIFRRQQLLMGTGIVCFGYGKYPRLYKKGNMFGLGEGE